jgi:hypothetical protein
VSIEPVKTRIEPSPGEVLLQNGLASDALPFLLAACRNTPSEWRHLLNLAVAYRLTGQYVMARESLVKASRLAPKAWPVYHTMANLSDDEGKFDLALAARQEAWKLCEGKSREVALGLAVSLLRKGNWREGWRFWEIGRFMYSWSPPPGAKICDGQNLNGKRLLVLTEGGYGDVFQNSRWLPLFVSQGAKVTFHVWERQIELLKCCPELQGVEFTPAGRDIDPSLYDYTTSLLSLPALLNATPETVPLPVTFSIEPFARNGHRRLGISWQAEEMSSHRKLRTIPLQNVESFSAIEAEWHSLVPKQTFSWMQPSPENWLDTARLMKSLDQVVACDSAVMHLAGCLLIPTIALLPVCAEWRFGTGDTMQPWYDSVRLVRAKKPDEWGDAVVEAVKLL